MKLNLFSMHSVFIKKEFLIFQDALPVSFSVIFFELLMMKVIVNKMSKMRKKEP